MDRKKRFFFLAGILFNILFLSAGCTVQKISEEKTAEKEFTVIGDGEIPAELKKQIDESKKGSFQLTYGENGGLYIAEGYGKQKTSGYSIEVREVYETENAVCIRTELIGPSREEEILKKATYPYVVVKIEYTEKHVVFE